MRSEQEMFSLILDTARRDDRIRAVYLNGSRANPNAPKDILQDYDVVYAVTDTRPFLEDKAWLEAFGERAILQEPDRSVLFPAETPPEDAYAFLMQFADGNRIDLTVQACRIAVENVRADSQTLILLDKDGVLPPLPPPGDADYHIQKPTREQYRDCCNEFWWITLYVAKGLYRGELLYALEHLNDHLRPMLLTMLDWQAGLATGFAKSSGKCHKYLPGLLPAEDAAALLRTWPDASRPAVEAALRETMALFRRSAAAVAGGMGFVYNRGEDDGASACLDWMLALENPNAPQPAQPARRTGTVTLLCGRICSGKSTCAPALANDAVVLNADEWMLALFPQQLGDAHPRILAQVKELLFEHAVRVARTGADAVLDLGFWTAAERAQARDYFAERGIATELRYIHISRERWLQNVSRRNEAVLANPQAGYFIDENMARMFWDVFEEPLPEEFGDCRKPVG